MNRHKEKAVGITMLLAFLGILVGIGGRGALRMAIFLAILGVFSSFLWSFKTKSQTIFYLVKIPLNILCNVFLWVLVLKAWTMRDFQKEFRQMEMEREV
jgi:hypothetical protein